MLKTRALLSDVDAPPSSTAAWAKPETTKTDRSIPRSELAASNPLAVGYAKALLMVGGSSLIGLMVAPRWGNGPVDLLYLPAVLGAAIFCGLGPALVAAVGATVAYNFLFTAPRHTFEIHSPADVMTVVILFIVAVVTSRLAASMRDQAQLAREHATRNAMIAGLARRLLSCTGGQEIAGVAVNELSRQFGCHAVLLIGADDPRIIASAPDETRLHPNDRAAAALTLGSAQAAGHGLEQASLAEWQFHPVASEHGVMAAAGLARADGLPAIPEAQLPLLVNLLDQVALALDRARLEDEAREFAASRERDQIRAVLLASIGQDIKPRLMAIISAARALRRGGLSEKALVSTVASEAAKLDRYVDNLLDLSPVSDQKAIEVAGVTIDLFRRSVRRGSDEIHLTPKEYSVLAELAKQKGRVLTHNQLLRAAWGPAQQHQIEYLRVAVSALRRKLERDPARPQIIINEPAVGYRLASSDLCPLWVESSH